MSNPLSQNKHFLNGVVKYQKEDYAGAISDFTLAIKEEENPNIYSERAIAHFHLKQHKNALADLNTALELEPENPYRFSSRAYIRDSMGDTNGAIEDYKKAIQLDPTDAIAHNNLGLLEEKLGYKEKAKKNWKKADELAEQEEFLKAMTKELGGPGEAVEEASAVPEPEPAAPQTPTAPTSENKTMRVMADVFRSRDTLREFIRFVKNGFRIKH